MKLCFVCKYPPIEGGVSMTSYWLARGLAERGHEVHVVTNAAEVEEQYRIRLEPSDDPWLEPMFPASGGRVCLHHTQPFHRRAMSHIPEANPFVSKLASVATDTVRVHGCEAIFAYYYEPYAVAASLAAGWTGRPLLVKHAGSDLDRLFRVPGLATTYKEVLRRAAGVVTRPYLRSRFLGMGIESGRLFDDVGFALPPSHFHPDGPSLELGIDPSVPVIGIYGKIGIAKGTFDLIAALSELADEGRDFRLAAVVGSVQAERMAPAIREAGLEKTAVVLPFLPHWRIPAFIRACTVACFLERDFPVAIHGPIVPREILACGTCLVVSREIASRQYYGEAIFSGHNAVVVDDPRRHAELAAALRPLLSDPQQAWAIGQRGHDEISAGLEDFDACVRDWEELFKCFLAVAAACPPAVPTDLVGEALGLLEPGLLAALTCWWPGMVERLSDRFRRHGSPYELALELCDMIETAVETEPSGHGREHEPGPEPDQVRGKMLAALRYQRARLSAASELGQKQAPTFPAPDLLLGEDLADRAQPGLVPVRASSARVESFEYNVVPLFTGEDTDLATIAQERILVLFHRSANLIPTELRVDEATARLLAGCDGSKTVEELVGWAVEYFGVDDTGERAQAQAAVLSTLERLHRAGIVAISGRRLDPLVGVSAP